MSGKQHRIWWRPMLLVQLAFATAVGSGPGAAQQERVIAEGKEEYLWQCASCHGAGGAGDGEMAAILVRRPTDLTQIAKRNDGVFPFWRIYHTIDSAERVTGHEFFQMPQFSKRFREDEGKPGYPDAYVRILLLTHFLETIQRK